nr:receptor-like protein 6 [Ziziphus jujuba var. spinosa]
MRHWKASSDCCLWDGVTCNMETGHVISLDLGSSWLHGPLRSNCSIFRLLHLKGLNLAFNNFTSSPIPSEFGQLSRLTHLNLSSSLFSGHIPSEISCLINLISLDLSSTVALENVCVVNFNKISSSCLTYIQSIDLSENYELTGFLPEFHSRSNLKSLVIDSTRFSGKVSDSMATSGTVPSSLWKLSELAELDLSSIISKFIYRSHSFFYVYIAFFSVPKSGSQSVHRLGNL